MTHECSHCGSRLDGPGRHCPPCVEALERPGWRPEGVAARVASDLTVRFPFYGVTHLESAYGDALQLAASLRSEIERRHVAKLDERTRCVHLVQHEARCYADTIANHRGVGVPLSIMTWSALRDCLLRVANRLKGGEDIADVVDSEGRRL